MIAQHPSLGTKIELFRSDARATDKGAWIGGWEFKGGQDPKNARWFAFEVDDAHLRSRISFLLTDPVGVNACTSPPPFLKLRLLPYS